MIIVHIYTIHSTKSFLCKYVCRKTMYNATIEPKSIHLAQAEHTSEIGSLHMLDEITE